jgi:hypothetical protein
VLRGKAEAVYGDLQRALLVATLRQGGRIRSEWVAGFVGIRTPTEVYRERWQIELFFKALKQKLKVKTFAGTTENALRIQISTALLALLLLKWLHFVSTARVDARRILPGNGLEPAIIRKGRIVLIDERLTWLYNEHKDP